MAQYTSQPRTENNADHAAEIAYRGTTKTFKFGFWEDDERTVPLTPFDAATYPRVQVYDLDDEVVVTGKPPSVRPSRDSGYWEFDFHVPPDADLTAIGQTWEFAAEIMTANGRREVYRTSFSVHDPNVVKATNTQRYYTVIQGKGVRVMYRSATQLHSLVLAIPNGTSSDTYLLERAAVGSGPYDIKEIVQDGLYVYYIDIPYAAVSGFTQRKLLCGEWLVEWDVQESASEPAETVIQYLNVVSRTILTYVPQVRFVADKLNKRSASVQAYQDADVLLAVQQGLRLVNSTFPYTGWGYAQVPDPLKVFVPLAAAYWLYCGQLGLAVDLQFNFSGQTTVLDQDQTGGIESMLERYRGALTEQLKEVKTDALRHMRPVGVVATRPTRARHMYNRVFKVSSNNSSAILGFLNSIGLI